MEIQDRSFQAHRDIRPRGRTSAFAVRLDIRQRRLKFVDKWRQSLIVHIDPADGPAGLVLKAGEGAPFVDEELLIGLGCCRKAQDHRENQDCAHGLFHRLDDYWALDGTEDEMFHLGWYYFKQENQ